MRQSERSGSKERESEVKTNSLSYSRREKVGDRTAVPCPPLLLPYLKNPSNARDWWGGSKEQDNKASPAKPPSQFPADSLQID